MASPQSATAIVEMVGIQPVTVRAHCVRSPEAFILMTIGATALQFDDQRIVDRAHASLARHDLTQLPRFISPHRFVRKMDGTSALGMTLRIRDDTPLGSRLEPVGAENPVTSCDLHVLVDEAAEPVSS